VDRLGVRPREDVTVGALRLYQLAVGHSFTRGRRTAHVAGACVYTICRQDGRPYMLIDVADALQANVYALGAVVLQLARLLRLDAAGGSSAGAMHAGGSGSGLTAALPVDPSLYIHRFADKLGLGAATTAVAHTALRLVASMRRDWLQTGRRPAGVCGAALFVAAAVHGCARSKEQIMGVVHVGHTTLRKRLMEFEGTTTGALTPGEFDAHAAALEQAAVSAAAAAAAVAAPNASQGVLTCAHAHQAGAVFAAQGMCRLCYAQYTRACAGDDSGADPPAFLRTNDSDRGLLLGLEAPLSEGAPADERAEMESALNEDAMRYALAHGGTLPPPAAGMQLALAPHHHQGAAHPTATATPAPTPTPAKRPAAGGHDAAPPAKRGSITASVIARAAAAHGASTAPLGGASQAGPSLSLEARGLAALRELVGDELVTQHCLPLVRGCFSGQVSSKHLDGEHPLAGTPATRLGAHVRRVGVPEMAYLLRAGAFDNSALAFLHQYASHDLGAALVRARQEGGASVAASLLPGVVPGTTDDTFSDVDDEDVDMYIASAEEAELKALIWKELHKDYVQAAEAREAAAAQAHLLLPPGGGEDGGAGGGEGDGAGAAGGRAAQKKGRSKASPAVPPASAPPGGLTTDGAAAAAPPESAAEATRDMLTRKKLSSKINYEALSTLFSQHFDADGGTDDGAAPGPADGRPAPALGRVAGVGAFGATLGAARRGGTASGLGSLRPVGAPGSLLVGGAARLASVALPSSSLGQGISGLPRQGVSFNPARVTASGATSFGTVVGAAAGGAGGTSRPRQLADK
jgi:transcription factor IIIB subunit 2